MSAIYQPKGRAGEYASLAVNLYTGCPHKCRYCYAPDVLRISREEFHSKVEPRPGILERIARWAEKNKPGLLLGEEPEPVFLCFLCDPYPTGCDTSTTREAIKILNDNGHPVKILTKAGLDVVRDFDLLAKNPDNWFGVTVSAMDASLYWEPGAAEWSTRLTTALAAKGKKIKTWLSIEPPVHQNQLEWVVQHWGQYFDFIWFGYWNHTDRLSPEDQAEFKKIDWSSFHRHMESWMRLFDTPYQFKRDLLRAAGMEDLGAG